MLNKYKVNRIANILAKVLLSFLFVFTMSAISPLEAKEMKGHTLNPKHPEDKGGFHREKMKHRIDGKDSEKNHNKMDMNGMKMNSKHPENKGGFHREKMKHRIDGKDSEKNHNSMKMNPCNMKMDMDGMEMNHGKMKHGGENK